MIARPRPTAWGLLFILRGSVIPHIAAKVAVIVALSCVVAWLHARQWFAPGHLNAVPFSLFGLALSVFLGFRNNVCYDRWWEARKQWAELSAQCRSLARETAAVLSGAADAPRQARIVRRLIGFNHALVARLRGGDPLTAARPWLPDDESMALAGHRNVPDAILRAVTGDLHEGGPQRRYGEVVYQGLQQRVLACAQVQAACERIKTTPTPFAYSLLLHRTAWLFCLLLPFGLVGTLGPLTPLAVAFVAYTFFGLDALGDELEEPFGLAENDLPLAALARDLEIDLLEGLGAHPLPAPLLPRGYVLT